MSSLVISTISAIIAFILSIIESKISKTERSQTANLKIAGLVFVIVFGTTFATTKNVTDLISTGTIDTGNPTW